MATILIADDKGSNLAFLTTLFGYFGHRVVEAADDRNLLMRPISAVYISSYSYSYGTHGAHRYTSDSQSLV